MRWCIFLVAAVAACAAPRVDSDLLKMVPPGATSIVGARMDLIAAAPVYQKMMAQQKLPQLEQFARLTGFDPRRDVRELLWMSLDAGNVVVARGSFHVVRPDSKTAKLVKHGTYSIWSFGEQGYCILDATMAAAGNVTAIGLALDEWTRGKHAGAPALMGRAAQIGPQSAFWGVSTGFAGFLADNLPMASSGVDFSKIFRGMDDTWFWMSFVNGLEAQIHGNTATEQDAANLRDMAKGLVGLGRLRVPNDQPEMLRVWDGITVDQSARSVTVKAVISQNLVDKMVEVLFATTTGRGPASGRGRAGNKAPPK